MILKILVTTQSQGKVPKNYSSYLLINGLQGARIGVLRELAGDDMDPEIGELLESAIEDLHKAGAEIVDPLEITEFDSLRQDQWCPMFKQDINTYLQNLNNGNVQVQNLERYLQIRVCSRNI